MNQATVGHVQALQAARRRLADYENQLRAGVEPPPDIEVDLARSMFDVGSFIQTRAVVRRAEPQPFDVAKLGEVYAGLGEFVSALRVDQAREFPPVTQLLLAGDLMRLGGDVWAGALQRANGDRKVAMAATTAGAET